MEDLRKGYASTRNHDSAGDNCCSASLLPLCEYLDSNPLPAFVSGLANDTDGVGPSLEFVHTNPALREALPKFHDLASASLTDDPLQKVSAHLLDSKNGKPTPGTRIIISFYGYQWSVAVVQHRWAVVTALDFDASRQADAPSSRSSAAADGTAPSSTTATVVSDKLGSRESIERDAMPNMPLGYFVNPQGVTCTLGDPDYLQWLHSLDWASLTCGPVEMWSSRLRHTFEMALASTDPVTLLWGPDYIFVYNHAYSQLIGDKHPAAFGRPFAQNWVDVWPAFRKSYENIKTTGQPLLKQPFTRNLNRDGYLEEIFVDSTTIPVIDEDTSVAGLYVYVYETSRQVLSERRLQTLLHANGVLSTPQHLSDIWQSFARVLGEHTGDVQFAGVYSVAYDQSPNHDGMSPRPVLEARVNFSPPGDDAYVSEVDPGEDELSSMIHVALRTGQRSVLSLADGTLSRGVVEHLRTLGVEGLFRDLIVEPAITSGDKQGSACLIIGVNPLRKVDTEYLLFSNLLVRQVESAMTVVGRIAQERALQQAQAALDYQGRFQRFAERAPIGIFMVSHEGAVTFSNQALEELTGSSKEEMLKPMAWLDAIHPESLQTLQDVWVNVNQGKASRNAEVQYKKPWKSSPNNPLESLDRTYAMFSSYTEYSDPGEPPIIIGCATDVSHFKWAEKIESEKLAEAIETKRQQENFLDMTSHELRNPLNVILQCAAELLAHLTNAAEQMASGVVKECIQLADTLVYCANHQKRIVDDVLTLSRLDFSLLQLCPSSTDPLKLVELLSNVFATELRNEDINLAIHVGLDYEQLGVRFMLFDPHRIAQVILNLLSNAIKFTRNQATRHISILLNASLVAPQESDGLQYVQLGNGSHDPTNDEEWGSEDIVFLSFRVSDTGPGMTPEETDRLFKRFAQASPRTHVEYGGSGLGLFICRQLIERHGGRIRVSSSPGQGTVMEFFIKARRSSHDAASPTAVVDLVERLRRAQVLTPPAPDLAKPESVANALPIAVNQNRETSTCSPTVLIVEDNLINQRMLQRSILKHGYQARVANHGEEALAAIAGSTWNAGLSPSSNEPDTLDIVLCDIEMPVMDGKTFVRRVRQLQSERLFHPDIPVIAITGNARMNQVQDALACGFDAVITKPYKMPELFKVMNRWMKPTDGDQTASTG